MAIANALVVISKKWEMDGVMSPKGSGEATVRNISLKYRHKMALLLVILSPSSVNFTSIFF